MRKIQSFASLLVLVPLLSHAQESKPVKIIEPKKQVEKAKSARIDTEKFQVGLTYGYLSLEEFNTNPVWGLSATYQLTSKVLLKFDYAVSDVDLTTFEAGDGIVFVAEDDRELTYTTLGGAYKLFTARSFFRSKSKYDSDIYVTASVGQYDFAAETEMGFAFGISYRTVLTDWLVMTVDFDDHIVEVKDVFGDGSSKNSQNLEFALGLNALF